MEKLYFAEKCRDEYLAAKIHKEYGENKLYEEYMLQNLDDTSDYSELANYYKKHRKADRAVELMEEVLEKSCMSYLGRMDIVYRQLRKTKTPASRHRMDEAGVSFCTE